MKKNRALIFGVVIVLVSLLLRTMDLSHASYWTDEMSSVHFAGHPSWQALLWDNSPVLYHLLLKFWIMSFGDSESATRSLSAVLSALTTALWAREGYRQKGLFGLVLAAGSHALLAVSIFHGRETRMYALFELSSTMLVILFLRTIDNNIPSHRFILLTLLLLMFSHFLAAVPLTVGFFMLLLLMRHERVARLLFVGLIFATVISLLSLKLIRWDSLHWQEAKFVLYQNSHWPWQMLQDFFGGNLGLAAALILTALSLRSRDRQVYFLLGSFVIILSAATAAGFIMQRAVFLPRYFVYLLPLIIGLLLQARFLIFPLREHWQFNAVGMAALAVFLGCQIYRAQEFIYLENPAWREAAQSLVGHPHVKIFTTRPLSLRSPYFDRQHIEFAKLYLARPESFSAIQEAQRAGYEVWVLENYWGLDSYHGFLQKFAAENGCVVQDNKFTSRNPDVIHLFRVNCP